MPTITKEIRLKIAQELKARNGLGESWRKIAASYNHPAVKAGTLCRIASSNGDWLPKDRSILEALGLIEPRQHEPQPDWLVKRKKAIRRMVKETKQAVLRK